MPQAKSSLLDELTRLVPDLDELIADMSSGRPSHTQHDSHADQAVELANRILVAARGPGRSVNPPLGRVGRALAW